MLTINKLEIQRKKINAVRKLLRSAGPLTGAIAVIADQVIAPMLAGVYSSERPLYDSLQECSEQCAQSLAACQKTRGGFVRTKGGISSSTGNSLN